ncbi:sugar ABC transporter ATP-binding protein [Vibrio nigripulchritudo]|uniref:sugar ABC transporter ATP-binding protein n=1 Tax=Vibrio nigripulchritudo TaxID=28173 RepID=UPI002490995A|nr:sugar ABC transporter ATP-binding protein [Vibrio nigripulchritudo]BDU37333.1 ribose import ATP-binding protein RbsA [Vibrio nigripulchritudo]BDU43053.1 ribose import ATP-binding protein RbsA [Vibrio nigripulchritudo]
MKDVVFNLKNINKAFNGVRVLSDVNFDLKRGEIVSLLGANGAGKSTLMKILTGVYTKDSGDIEVEGQSISFVTPQDAIAKGIKLLPQEISVMSDMTVAENICLGDLPEKSGFIKTLDYDAMNGKTLRLLKQLGVSNIKPDSLVSVLTTQQKRIVELARALDGEAKVIVLDEPTASLNRNESQALFESIRELSNRGVSIVFISHYLDEVFEISDRIAVLRDGQMIGSYAKEETSVDEVLNAMLGTTTGPLFPDSDDTKGEPIFSLSNMQVPEHINKLTFQLREGEIVGLFGLIGSGLEYFGQAIFDSKVLGGTMDLKVRGKRIHTQDPQTAIRAGIGLVSAERKRDGIIPDMSVSRNMTLAHIHQFTQNTSIVDREKEKTLVTRWIDNLGIKLADLEQEIRFLSGGNQQKVCLARWLVSGIKVLILEEPTRGVDIGAKKDIYRCLRDLAEEGVAIVVTSTDAEEIAGIADRKMVLAHGDVVLDTNNDITVHELMHAAATHHKALH